MNLLLSWPIFAPLAVFSLILAGTAAPAIRAVDEPTDEGRRRLLADRSDHSGALAVTAASGPVAAGPLRQSAEGEDIGPSSLPRLLRTIAQEMRSTQGLLGRRDTSERTQQAQEQIIEQLTTLIDQLDKSRTSADLDEESSPTAGKDQAGQVPSSEPRHQSATRLDGQAAPELDRSAIRSLISDRWGHLPPHLREPMLSVEIERFVPKYERLIERYYQRLAQETDALP